MANGKKSFVLYADLLKSVDHLTDEELGRLFKHMLEYVNDLKPVLEDRLLLTAWKPIERSLKEDLKKWERQLEQRRQAGKKSAESRKRNSTSVNERQRASTDSVTVTVTDNVINNTIPKLEDFLAYGFEKMPDVSKEALALKYESWKENGWCVNRQGKKQPIKNWKATLINTLPYLPKQPKPVRNLAQEYYENVMKQVNANK